MYIAVLWVSELILWASELILWVSKPQCPQSIRKVADSWTSMPSIHQKGCILLDLNAPPFTKTVPYHWTSMPPIHQKGSILLDLNASEPSNLFLLLDLNASNPSKLFLIIQQFQLQCLYSVIRIPIIGPQS